MNQNDFLLIIFVVIFIIFNYFAYQIWFQPQKLINRFRKRYSKLPNWYPFKGLAKIMASDETAWIVMNKILSIIGEIILIVILIMVLNSRGMSE